MKHSCNPIIFLLPSSFTDSPSLFSFLFFLISSFYFPRSPRSLSAMASSSSNLLIISALFALSLLSSKANAQIDETSLKLVGDALDWPLSMSLYSDIDDLEGENGEIDEDEGELGRRSLFWRRVRYYISYGALSANRIPCPPRSGRSYYTHNCYNARGPVHPYTRGCSAITRCRR